MIFSRRLCDLGRGMTPFRSRARASALGKAAVALAVLLTIHCVAIGAEPAAGAAPAQERPNIVFILADDLGVNDLACYGRSEHVTPVLDRLAREGLRFSNAYAAQS